MRGNQGRITDRDEEEAEMGKKSDNGVGRAEKENESIYLH
jgi:hypothetical protein